MVRKWPLFWCVVIVVFACFIPDLSNSFLDWDDFGYVVDNVYIRSLSFETVIWAFTKFYCNYWAPLTWLSLAVDYSVWGLNPVGYHLTNNFIHALNAGLFFLIAHHLLTRYATRHPGSLLRDAATVLGCSLLAALFWGLHPLRVESVAWAAERKDVLSTLFGLGAVLAYLRYTDAPETGQKPASPRVFLRSPRYWVMLLLYALSLSSKAMLITLPVVLLILDWFPLQRNLAKFDKLRLAILEKLPLLLIAALASAKTMQAMAITSVPLAHISLTTRVLVAFTSILQYLRQLVFPFGISPVYFHPGKVSFDLGHGVAIAVFAAISGFCLLKVRRHPAFLAAWLLFLVTIFPVLGLTQNGPTELAARFTYIPVLSLSLLGAVGVAAFRARMPKWGRGVRGGAAMVLAGCALVTVRDIGTWKNDITLWSRVIELQPHKFGKAYFQRSLFLNIAGEYEKALADVNEALSAAKLKKYGGIHEIYVQRAKIRRNMKDFDGAIADLSTAIELSGVPYTEEYYRERGAIYRETGNLERANQDSLAAGATHESR